MSIELISDFQYVRLGRFGKDDGHFAKELMCILLGNHTKAQKLRWKSGSITGPRKVKTLDTVNVDNF